MKPDLMYELALATMDLDVMDQFYMTKVVTANEVTRESKFGDLKPGSVVDVILPIS